MFCFIEYNFDSYHKKTLECSITKVYFISIFLQLRLKTYKVSPFHQCYFSMAMDDSLKSSELHQNH